MLSIKQKICKFLKPPPENFCFESNSKVCLNEIMRDDDMPSNIYSENKIIRLPKCREYKLLRIFISAFGVNDGTRVEKTGAERLETAGMLHV